MTEAGREEHQGSRGVESLLEATARGFRGARRDRKEVVGCGRVLGWTGRDETVLGVDGRM